MPDIQDPFRKQAPGEKFSPADPPGPDRPAAPSPIVPPHQRNKPVFFPLILTLLLLVGGGVVGETATKGKPRGIPMGIFRIHPKMLVESRWEDNIYKTETDTRSDFLVKINPTIQLITHWKKNEFSATYTGEVERYREHDLENNSGHKVNVDLKLVPSKRVEFGLGYEFLLEHEDRGTLGSSALVANLGPNKWQQHGVTGMGQYTFHRLRAKLNAGHFNRISVNNAQYTQDRYWNDTALTLMWALAPKTALLTEFGWKDIHYDNSPLLNSDEARLLLGVTWKATGKTEGRLKFGAVEKSFEFDDDADHRTVSWDAEVVWHPQTRTQVNFAANRNFQEGEAGAEHFIETGFRTALKHYLRPRWHLTSGLGFTNGNYDGGREEDYWNGEVGMEYRLPRWFTLSAEYMHDTKRSSEDDADYDSNAVLLSILGEM